MKVLTRVMVVLATAVLASFAKAGDFTTYSIGNSLTQDLLFQVYGHIYTYEQNLGNTYHWGVQFRPGTTLTYLHDNPWDIGQEAKTQSGIGYYASSPTSNGGWPTSNTQPWNVALTSAENTWDMVTLEPYKSGIVGDENYCTLGMDTASMNDIITKTRASNAANSVSTRFFLYAAWPDWSANLDVHNNAQYQTNFTATTTNEDSQASLLSRGYYQNLYSRVHTANPDVSLSVIPVGEVYYKLSQMMDNNAFSGSGLTSIGQLYRDAYHANVLGRDIIAWIAFATLFKQSPLGLDRHLAPQDKRPTGTILLINGLDRGYRQFQTSSLTLSDKQLIQNTIWQVLVDNSAYTNVPNSPASVKDSFTAHAASGNTAINGMAPEVGTGAWVAHTKLVVTAANDGVYTNTYGGAAGEIAIANPATPITVQADLFPSSFANWLALGFQSAPDITNGSNWYGAENKLWVTAKYGINGTSKIIVMGANNSRLYGAYNLTFTSPATVALTYDPVNHTYNALLNGVSVTGGPRKVNIAGAIGSAGFFANGSPAGTVRALKNFEVGTRTVAKDSFATYSVSDVPTAIHGMNPEVGQSPWIAASSLVVTSANNGVYTIGGGAVGEIAIPAPTKAPITVKADLFPENFNNWVGLGFQTSPSIGNWYGADNKLWVTARYGINGTCKIVVMGANNSPLYGAYNLTFTSPAVVALTYDPVNNTYNALLNGFSVTGGSKVIPTGNLGAIGSVGFLANGLKTNPALTLKNFLCEMKY